MGIPSGDRVRIASHRECSAETVSRPAPSCITQATTAATRMHQISLPPKSAPLLLHIVTVPGPMVDAVSIVQRNSSRVRLTQAPRLAAIGSNRVEKFAGSITAPTRPTPTIVPRLACHRTWWRLRAPADVPPAGAFRFFQNPLFLHRSTVCIQRMFYVSCMSTLPPCSSVSSVSLSILRKMQHQQQPTCSPVCGVLPPPAYAALSPPPAPASAPQSVGAYQTSL
jgi:hypothetical protein